MTRIAYTKIGRSQAYDPKNWGVAGGDWEAPMLLNRLARFLPEVEFVIAGHSDGVDPQEVGLPNNVTNPMADRDFYRQVRQAQRVINVRGTIPPENSMKYIEYMRKIWDPVLNGCDGFIAWIGQNDTVNQPIPKVRRMQGDSELGASRHIYIRLNSYLHSWINAWRDEDPHGREPVYLCSDIWNTLKGRDLKWPHRQPVICQYNFKLGTNHYRWGDPRSPEECGYGDVATWHREHPGCWRSSQHYEYAGLELGSCVPSGIELNDDWSGRGRFGVMVNQSREASGRDEVLVDWIKPMWPDWVVGSWDEDRKQGMTIEPYAWHGVPQLLQTVRSTLLVPIRLNKSWATPKAWECFASGTVGFMHPGYDTQGHVLPTLEECDERQRWGEDSTLIHLARWLRVETVAQLRKRVDHLNAHPQDWEWLVKAQRALYNVTREENLCLRTIANRLGVVDSLTRVA